MRTACKARAGELVVEMVSEKRVERMVLACGRESLKVVPPRHITISVRE